MIRLAFAIICLLLSFSISTAETILVPSQQPTIQAGLDIATAGDTVLVASGVYTGTGNRDLDFGGKSVVLKSVAGADSTVIDCERGGRGFDFSSGEDSNAVVDGFRIFRGRGYSAGGAILCYQSSPTLINLIADSCITAGGGPSGGKGGGISCYDGANPIIRNSVFRYNQAGATQGSTDGGGAIHCDNSSPIIEYCTFYGNRAVLLGYGAAIACHQSEPVLRNNTFVNNGGPDQDGVIICRYSSPVIENCIIAGNSGFAVRCVDSSSAPSIICSNIYGNLGGDWVDYISSQLELNDNFSLDPMFCDSSSMNYYLDGQSPCTARNSQCGELIGSLPIGCNCCLVPGDVDNSGLVDIADLTHLVDYMFRGGEEPSCDEQADIDGNSQIDINDITNLVDYFFRGGNPPHSCT